MTETAPTRTVTIPACDSPGGTRRITITLTWLCPVCGGPRGEVDSVISYDGSIRMSCDGWTNPCGHIDFYSNVRAEAARHTATA